MLLVGFGCCHFLGAGVYFSCSVHRSPCPENYVSERVACLCMCIHPEQKSDREKPSFQNAMCFCRLLCLQCWWSQLFTQSLAQLKVSERCPAVCNCLLFSSFFFGSERPGDPQCGNETDQVCICRSQNTAIHHES